MTWQLLRRKAPGDKKPNSRGKTPALPPTQEDYLDAGDGMLICMKRTKKRNRNLARKGCWELEKAPDTNEASDTEQESDPSRQVQGAEGLWGKNWGRVSSLPRNPPSGAPYLQGPALLWSLPVSVCNFGVAFLRLPV